MRFSSLIVGARDDRGGNEFGTEKRWGLISGLLSVLASRYIWIECLATYSERKFEWRQALYCVMISIVCLGKCSVVTKLRAEGGYFSNSEKNRCRTDQLYNL